jgi:hypothetical protein
MVLLPRRIGKAPSVERLRKRSRIVILGDEPARYDS